jgi:nucleotide-binding universal stress UspA family protein
MQTETRLSFLARVEPHRTTLKSAVPQGSLRRILVCVDHSRFANVALRQAVSVATTFDSAVTLLYVLQPSYEAVAPRPTDAFAWDIATRQAATYLEGLKSEIAKESGVVVDSKLEQGHPAERIASLTGELNADLVVLGSHGESGLLEWNLGSTAEHVLAVARRSVLIARGQSGSEGPWAPKRILVPLDGSLRTESVLPVVARLAREHGAEVTLAHVVVEPSVTAILRADADLKLARDLATRLEGHAARYLGSLRDRLRNEGVDARTLVLRRADERQALLALTRAQGADLVVLSAHGTTCDPGCPFGSATKHLVAYCRVSLLVLQDVADGEGGGRKESAEETPPPLPLRASFADGPT